MKKVSLFNFFSPDRLHDLVLALARNVVARKHDAGLAPGGVVGHLSAHEEAEVGSEAAF